MGKTFLALGDSYTLGEAVEESERWPLQLVALLKARGHDFHAPEIIAQTGWTTDELAAAMHPTYPPGARADFDLVSLLIGVNNQYRDGSLDSFRDEFSGLLGRAVLLAGGEPQRVRVLAIPDWGVTPFGANSGRDVTRIAAELDAYNAVCAASAALREVRFVDTSEVSRQRGAEWVADDGLHPSDALYAAWAEAVDASLA